MTQIIIKRSKLNKSAPVKNTHKPIRKLSRSSMGKSLQRHTQKLHIQGIN